MYRTPSDAQQGRLVAVLYDAKDANRFLAERPDKVDLVLPLTPAALSVLQGTAVPILDPWKRHNSFSHRRDMIRGERLEKYLQAAFSAKSGLNLASQHTLMEDLLRGCHVSSRLWTTLRGPFNWLLPMPSGWHLANSREEAHQLLLNSLMSSYNNMKEAQALGAGTLFSSGLLHLLNLVFLKLIANTRPVFLFKFKRGFEDLTHEMQRQNPGHWQVAPRLWDGSPEPIKNLSRLIRQILFSREIENRAVHLAVPARKMPEKVRLVDALIEIIPDPIAKAGALAIKNRLYTTTQLCESAPDYLKQYLQASNARAVLNFDENLPQSTILAYAAKEAGIPSLLICHTSVSPAEDSVTSRAKRHRTRHLACSPLCDMTFVQTPAAEAAAMQFGAEIPRQKIRPFVWGLQAQATDPALKVTGQERVILHASNYFEWARYEPWVYETSLEFVANLKTLIEALNTLPNTKLIIRMKPNFGTKGEFTPETLDKLLPPGNWEIRSSGSFYDDLAQADLVVASHSTSIEEGFIVGKPALLLSDRFRYAHTDARKTSPSGIKRSAAYCPADAEALTKMLETILEYHAGTPLTEAELKDRLWDNRVAGMEALATLLVDFRLSREEFMVGLKLLNSPDSPGVPKDIVLPVCMEGAK